MDNNNQERRNAEVFAIDVMHIVRMLWRRAWAIVLCGLIGAALGFTMAAYIIEPTYSSSVKLYVNNSTVSLGSKNFSISAGDLSTAERLLKTYGEILQARTTLERVAEKSGLDYSWSRLAGMISYVSLNETEIMKVTVTCNDPYDACTIANTVAEVLPVRMSEIIDGASMEIVDSAIPETNKIAPSVTRYTAMGLFVGAILMAGVLALFALLDGTIHDEEFITQNYHYPILGKVPDLMSEGTNRYKSYGYYYYQRNKKKKQPTETK